MIQSTKVAGKNQTMGKGKIPYRLNTQGGTIYKVGAYIPMSTELYTHDNAWQALHNLLLNAVKDQKLALEDEL